MPKCPDCGTQNSVINEWCTSCGGRLPLATTATESAGGTGAGTGGRPSWYGQSASNSWSQNSNYNSPTGDYFAFRTMVTPVVIRILYVLGALGVTLGGVGCFIAAASAGHCTDVYGNSYSCPAPVPPIVYVIGGLVILTFGNLIWRVICEQAIIFFSIHDRLRSMDASLEKSAQNQQYVAP